MSAPSTKRTREMYALYRDGATLREVGARFGVTAVRVRQIFSAAGLETRSRSGTAATQRNRLAVERGDEIRAAFLRSRNLREVARRLGIQERVVREVVQSSFSERQLRSPRPIPPTYSDEQLIAFLREASKSCDGSLPLGVYKRYAEGRRTKDGRPWPAAQTFSKRLGDGSWSKALRSAGLRATPHSRGRTFTDKQCIEALRTAARELNKTPTAREYRAFAQGSGGDLPSEAAIRGRFGTWYGALAAARL